MRSPIPEVHAALALLTRLPLDRPAGSGATAGAAAFPLVGALVGAVAAIPVLALGAAGLAQPAIAAILAVAVVAIVTGGLHLDGLSDTADALLAPDRARADAARSDPAAGPGGVTALLLVVGLEVVALVALAEPGTVALALVVATSVARAVPVVAIRLRPAPSGAEGFGAWFSRHVSGVDAVLAEGLVILVVLAAALLAGGTWPGIAGLGGAAFGLAVALWLARARGRLDGDALGASVELTVAGTLLLAVLAHG